jgi:hypothetical protein
LTQGTAGITESTYLGAAIPGQLCLNFGYHFKTINSSWPTPANPLPPFANKLHFSLDAQDYVIVTINIHGDCRAPIQALLTANEVSPAHHRTRFAFGQITLMALMQSLWQVTPAAGQQ